MLERMPRAGVVAEIGVHEGEFSREILEATQPARIHLIDPWIHQSDDRYQRAWYGGRIEDGQVGMDARYQRVLRMFEPDIESGRVLVHRQTSSEVVESFDDAYFDWIYIDGNHLYEFVKQDLDLFYPKIKPGGFITGDDYGVRGWWEYGVQRAVDDFLTQHDDLSMVLYGRQYVIELPG